MCGVTDSNSTIGEKIRKRRQVLGWTQAQFAARCGVGASAVINWEQDRYFPRRHLGRVEDVLGIRLTGDTQPRVLDPLLTALVNDTLEDPVTRRRVIGLLEGTLTWPQ